MKKTVDWIKTLIRGESERNKKKLFLTFIIVCISLHFIFCIFFSLFGPFIIAVFNFISFLCFIFCFYLLNTNRAGLSFIICSIETLLFIVATTFFLKDDFGFNIYALIFIPLSYYVAYDLKKNGKYLIQALPYSLFSGGIFLLSKAYKSSSISIGFNADPFLVTFIYLINAIFAIIALTLICNIFAKEAKNMQFNLEKENTTLDFYANIDPLTQLQNRRHMETTVSKLFSSSGDPSKSFCFLMCDIDDFKKINDTYGHSLGDSVLKDVSIIISNNIRDFDFASRWGGEEFLILIKGPITVAAMVSERIRDSVSHSIVSTAKGDIQYTLTIGISQYTIGTTFNELLLRADENLYKGKRTGKNCVVY